MREILLPITVVLATDYFSLPSSKITNSLLNSKDASINNSLLNSDTTCLLTSLNYIALLPIALKLH